MENTKQNGNQQHIDENLLNEALDDFDNDDKVSVSQCTDRDEDVDPELEKEYENFIKSLNQEGPAGEEDTMNQFAKLMGNLMNGMKLDEQANPGQEGPGEAQLKNILNDLMKNADNDNFDSMAQTFLKDFMDKDILQEPLDEAKKNYESYLAEKGKDLNETDKKNYTEQYNCILQLLECVDKEPENKDKMINIFEKMHDYGMPPEGILNPLSKVTGQQQPGFVPGPENMSPEDLAKQMENCNIF